MDPAKKGQNVEEDDEFEEFSIEDWQPTRDDMKNEQLWDKGWDDESVDDPIGQQLREILPTLNQAQPAK
ncbi:hypothetical protein V8C86DRAFT_2470067 [Haematococcus lacustris]